MTNENSVRWPVAPLWDVAEATSAHHLAELLGVSDRTVVRWLVVGLLDTQADRMAVRLGYHPSMLWPEWFDVLPCHLRPRLFEEA